MFADPDAYNYTPFPGTNSTQQENLKAYDSAYAAAAKKLKAQGYSVVGNNYFKKVPDANNASGYRLEKVGKVITNFDNRILTETAATAQPPNNSSGNITSVGGKTYNMDDPAQVKALNAVLEADRNTRSDQKFADLRGGSGLKPDGGGRFPASTGRDADPPTQNPNDIDQKGTSMGSAAPLTMEQAKDILNRRGLEGKGYDKPFSSTQLPATSASDYFSETDVSYSQELPENMFNKLDLKLASNVFDAGSGVEYGKNLPQFPASGQIEFLQKNGAPLTVSSGTFKVTETNETAQEPEINKIPPRPRGGRQAEKWDQQYGRMRQPVEREKSELEKNYKPDLERRKALLDDDLNSMEALRAIEAQKDIVFTGNQYYLKNPNAGQEGEPDFFYSGKEHRDIIMGGGDAAQELKDKYVKGIVNSTNKTDEEEDNK